MNFLAPAEQLCIRTPLIKLWWHTLYVVVIVVLGKKKLDITNMGEVYKKTKKKYYYILYNIILSQTSQTTRHRSGHESGDIANGSAAGSMYRGQELYRWGQKTPTRTRSPDRGMSRWRGHFWIWTLVKIISDPPYSNTSIIAASEDVTVIGGNRINCRIVGFHISNQSTGFDGP